MKHITTTLAIAIALTASASHAQQTVWVEKNHSSHAVSISPDFTTRTRTECSTAAPASSGGWLGPALGAIVGGGAGSQVGKGSGQAAAAAIGATLGAQAGGAIAGNSNSNGNSTTTQTCRDITDRTLNGYTMRTSDGRDVFVPLSLVQQFNSAGR